MSQQSAYSNSTEAVGVFHSVKDLDAAVDDLLIQGFNRMDLSVLASEATVNEKLHDIFIPVRDLEDRVGVPTAAYVSPGSAHEGIAMLVAMFVFLPAMVGGAAIVASGGAFAAAIAASAVSGGLGGSIGGILAAMLGRRHGADIENQLLNGGLLLWVRTRDQKHEERALGILAGHSADNVHLHNLPLLLIDGCSVPVEDVVETNSAKTANT